METRTVKFEGGWHEQWKVARLVKEGAAVKEGDALARLEGVKGASHVVTAPIEGDVHFLQAEGATLAATTEPSASICEVRHCTHPILMGVLCAVCGKTVDADSVQRASSTGDPFGTTDENFEDAPASDRAKIVVQGGTTLSLSRSAAENFQNDMSGRLLRERKLALVLDLDSTLVHATDDQRAGQHVAPDVLSFNIPGTRGLHYIKLRAGLLKFLEEANKLYQLTIYTAGTRAYAERVAACMDPSGRIFQNRIVSATDTKDLGVNNKSLARIFPSGVPMALILDDREDVWRGEQQRHLVLVKPYLFWPPTHREVHHAPGAVFGIFPPRGEVRSRPSTPTSAPSASPSKVQEPAPAAESAPFEPVAICAEGEGAPAALREAADAPETAAVAAYSVDTPPLAASSSPSAGAAAAQEASIIPGGVAKVSELSAEPEASASSADTATGTLGEFSAAAVGAGNAGAVNGTGALAPAEPAEAESTSAVINSRSLAGNNGGSGGASSSGGSSSGGSSSGGSKSENGQAMDAAPAAPKAPPKSGHIRPRVLGRRNPQKAAALQPDSAGSAPLTGADNAGRASSAPEPQESRETGDDPTTLRNGARAAQTAAIAAAPADSAASAEGARASEGSTRPNAADAAAAAAAAAAPPPLPPPPPPPAQTPAPENDLQLECCLSLLRRVHARFYEGGGGAGRDAGKVLQELRGSILRGVVLVMSGVVPLNEEDPRRHALWRYAVLLGAEVRTEVGPGVTHVVAARLGTEKTAQGLRMPGVFVVHVDWLMHSIWHLRREDERIFLLAEVCQRPKQPIDASTSEPEKAERSLKRPRTEEAPELSHQTAQNDERREQQNAKSIARLPAKVEQRAPMSPASASSDDDLADFANELDDM